MHSARELRSSAFEITVDGREAGLPDLFEGFGEHDRLGVIVGRPGGGLGASALITATITAFYDLQRARGPDFFVYPDYYLFHLGRPLGDHSRLDIWPAHKEVVVTAEAAAGPARRQRPRDHAARSRGRRAGRAALGARRACQRPRPHRNCLAYSASGRVRGADVRVRRNP